MIPFLIVLAFRVPVTLDLRLRRSCIEYLVASAVDVSLFHLHCFCLSPVVLFVPSLLVWIPAAEQQPFSLLQVEFK